MNFSKIWCFNTEDREWKEAKHKTYDTLKSHRNDLRTKDIRELTPAQIDRIMREQTKL